MGKQVWLSPGYSTRPVGRRRLSAAEAPVLPAHPRQEGSFQMTKDLLPLRAGEPTVVVRPAPHYRVYELREAFQAPIVPGRRHSPLTDGLAYGLRGLGAHRRNKAHEELPMATMDQSSSREVQGMPEVSAHSAENSGDSGASEMDSKTVRRLSRNLCVPVASFTTRVQAFSVPADRPRWVRPSLPRHADSEDNRAPERGVGTSRRDLPHRGPILETRLRQTAARSV